MYFSGHSAVAIKTKRPMRSMSVQCKLEAIRRVHAGESKASVARKLGVPESTLRGWCKNEEKILYQSSQSRSKTEQPQHKRIKLEERRMHPFDFSSQINENRACSPDVALDYSMSGPNSPNQPLNMTARMGTLNTPTQASDTGRTELNRSQFLPTSSNVSGYQTDNDASLATQWSTITMKQEQHSVGTVKVSNMACSSGGLLAIADQKQARYLPSERQSVHDSVWHWLQYQHLTMPQAQMTPHQTIDGGTSSPTSTVNPAVNGTSSSPNSLIMKLYEQAFIQQVQQMSLQEPITNFHQTLTKDAHQNVPQPAADRKAEGIVDRNHGGKALLDNPSFHSHDVKQEPLINGLTRGAAAEHAERFWAWLESSNDPSVTAVLILQFKHLLDKLKEVRPS